MTGLQPQPQDGDARPARKGMPAGVPADADILELVAGGRHHAFDLLVARYGARVRRYIEQVVGRDGPAEDIAQEVFIKVFRRSGECRARAGSFQVWLFRVARNEAVDWLRREGTRRRVLSRLGPAPREPRTPDETLELSEFRSALGHALAELPEIFRSAFLLREQEGLSYEEISEVLDLSPKTVSTRIHRARLRLRAALSPFLAGRRP